MSVDVAIAIAAFFSAWGVFALLASGVRYFRIRGRLSGASVTRPVDQHTGLPDNRAFALRTRQEIRVARRSSGNVWLLLLTVLEGDSDAFGILLADAARMPEYVFRLSPVVYCLVRIDTDVAVRAEVISRIDGASARVKLAAGEAIWPADSDDPVTMLHKAINRSVAVVKSPAPVAVERPSAPQEGQ